MIDRCYIEITNTCNLNCDFCPKHHRRKRQLSAGEFNLLTDRVRGKVSFLYFHLMGEPLLHPLLPQFIRTANEKGFKTVLTSNGTLLHRCLPLLESLPHKIQLSLHSHESNARGELAGYMQEVMQFSVQAAEKGTCMENSPGSRKRRIHRTERTLSTRPIMVISGAYTENVMLTPPDTDCCRSA